MVAGRASSGDGTPLDRVSRVSIKQKRVVVLDDDRDVAEVIQTILIDEGFAVSCLYGPDYEGVATAVKDLAPDCVILDGAGSHETDPWVVARSLAMLKPAIPTVMLSGSETNREEAILGESDRAKQSAIAAVVPKPFDIDRLVLAVRNALGQRGRQRYEAMFTNEKIQQTFVNAISRLQ